MAGERCEQQLLLAERHERVQQVQFDLGTGAGAEFEHKQPEQPKTLRVASFTFILFQS